MYKKKYFILLSIVTLVVILGTVSVANTKLNLSISHLVYKENPEKSSTTRKEVERHLEEFAAGVKQLSSTRTVDKSATELPDEVNGIAILELIPYERVYKENPAFYE